MLEFCLKVLSCISLNNPIIINSNPPIKNNGTRIVNGVVIKDVLLKIFR